MAAVNSNAAAIGDNELQPGPYDGGINPDDAIGTLAAFVPIVFSSSANNMVDAAIAATTAGLVGNSTPIDGYGTPSTTTIAAANLGLQVTKYGRTTGLTQGEIAGINATVVICYEGRGRVCLKSARFVGQLLVTPGSFSAGGDSGSLIVTNDTTQPVGLLFAGSSSMTIANPIDEVLSALSAALSGGVTLAVDGN